MRLVLQERNPAYAELFSGLVEDVLRRVVNLPSPSAVVSTVLFRLATWQRFVADFGPGRLSDEARVGLVGELLALELLFLPRLTHSAAVDSWVGPRKAPQDFRVGTCLVEVKSSVAFSPGSFRVANLEQLSGDAGLPLFLCHFSMTVGGSTARNLPTIIDDLRGTIGASSPDAVDRFDALLFEAGYLEAFSGVYASPTYSARSMRFFRVAGGFPRLTPGGVPTGILSATYTLSLAACEQWQVPATECTALIESANV